MKKRWYKLALLITTFWWYVPMHASVHTSLEGTDLALTTTTAFGGPNALYVAGRPSGNKTFAKLALKRTEGAWKIEEKTLAPDSAPTYANSAPIVSTNKQLTSTALTVRPDGLPVLVGHSGVGYDHVYTFTDNKTGRGIVTNTLRFRNRLGHVPIKPAATLAASNDFTFIGVCGNEGKLEKDESGVALVHMNNIVLDATMSVSCTALDAAYGDTGGKATGPYTPRAVGFNLTATPTWYRTCGPMTSDDISAKTNIRSNFADFTQSGTMDLYYDNKLQKVYVGVSGIRSAQRADVPANADYNTIVSLLVGAPESVNGPLTLTSIIGDKYNAVARKDFETMPDLHISSSDDIFWNATKKDVTKTANAVFAGTRKIRTMHTSTGKSYAILNSMIAGDHGTFQNASTLAVYAVPLVDGPGAAPSEVGYIANLYDHSKRASATTNMPSCHVANTFNLSLLDLSLTDTVLGAVVGLSGGYLVHTDGGTFHAAAGSSSINNLTDMQVVGDTVYVACNGTRSDTTKGNGEEKGVFSSTALFDENGFIKAWTPWQRAMPMQRGVRHFAYDEQTGTMYHIVSDGADSTKDKVAFATTWGKGDTEGIMRGYTHGGQIANGELSRVLDNVFTPTTGGLLGLFSFDPETPGFNTEKVPNKAYDRFSMMIATGNGQLALIQTGTGGGTTPFCPTITYTNTPLFNNGAQAYVGGTGSNVFVYRGDDGSVSGRALANLGPITCAEVARGATGAAKGWVFVGGEGGLAVLREPTAGHGFWDAPAEGLARLATGKQDKVAANATLNSAFPGYDPATKESFFQFAQIAYKVDGKTPLNITNVRKLISTGNHLLVLTKDKMLSLLLDANDYKTAVGTNGKVQLHTDANLIHQVGIVPFTDPSEVLKDASGNPLLAPGDEFYDMAVVNKDVAGGTGVVVLATSKGLFVTDSTTMGENATRPYSVDGAQDFTCGPALKIDVVYPKRGGVTKNTKTAEHNVKCNLYVTALDAEQKNVCVYRFDVANGYVKQIREPYRDENGNPVNYFYKIGKIEDVAGMEWNGNLEMQAQAQHYGQHGHASDFVDRVVMGPTSDHFLKAYEPGSAIDLGLTLDKSWHPAAMCKDPASGTHYVATEFGVRCNE